MNKLQADAIAQALLEPHQRAQEELRVVAKQIERKWRIAWFTLAGCGAGAAFAHFSDASSGVSLIWGGVAGFAIGWLVGRTAGSSLIRHSS